jgi:poly(3-hydroxyalkanoate) synthetase
MRVASQKDGVNDKTQQSWSSYTRQFVDMRHLDFRGTNPRYCARHDRERGENLLLGLKHMLEDLEPRQRHGSRHQDDRLRRVRDRQATVATTPGKVVFQNDLISAASSTSRPPSRSNLRPLMIVPPGSTSSTS